MLFLSNKEVLLFDAHVHTPYTHAQTQAQILLDTLRQAASGPRVVEALQLAAALAAAFHASAVGPQVLLKCVLFVCVCVYCVVGLHCG